MVVRRLPNYNSELYHHGINGQKWGVKHGPPYPLGSASSTGSKVKDGAKPKTITTSKLADSKSTIYRNKQNNVIVSKKTVSKKTENDEIKNTTKTTHSKADNENTETKNKSEENFQISDKTKKILIAAGITAGAIVVGTVAYRTYAMRSKTLFDTTLNNVRFNRYQKGSNFSINDNLSSYMTKDGVIDKLHYKQLVGGKNGYDTVVSATAHDVKIPSFENAKNIFSKACGSDPSIQKDLSTVFKKNLDIYSSKTKKTPPDKRRIELFTKAIDAIENGKTDPKSQAIVYDAWNTMITNNNDTGGWDVTNKLFDIYKKQGYSAIWDNHDIYISGFKANNPMIIFDKSKFTDVSSRKMSKAEIEVGSRVVGPAFTAMSNPIDKISAYIYNPDVMSVRFLPAKITHPKVKRRM